MKKKQVKTSKKKEVVKKESRLALTPEYKETFKFKRWCRAYLDKKSSAYGNATEAAMQTYNTESRGMAGVLGHRNLKKLEEMNKMLLENEGFPYLELLKIGTAKMMKEGYDTWEKFMIRMGYFEPTQQQPVLNQFNINLADAITESRKARGLDK